MKPILPIGVWDDGRPAVPEVTAAALARMARAEVEGAASGKVASGSQLIDASAAWLKEKRLGYVGQPGPAWRDPTDPTVGWGVVFANPVLAEVRQALEPLRERRKGKVLPDWKAGHPAITWLRHQGITIANRDPTVLPYYILLVGTPKQIRFEDQYQLDRLRAVGRLDFGDDVEAYKSYVETVLAQEAHPTIGKRVVVSAARNNDEPTRLTADYLAPAIANHVRTAPALAAYRDAVQLLNKATCEEIRAALRPDAAGHAPALAFIAGHGLRSTDADKQGAWIGSEWDQPAGGAIPEAALLTGAAVGPGFHAPGSILCSPACFGAGSPAESEYARTFNAVVTDPKERLEETLAAEPFVARLPKRLLSFRQAGAPAACLAFVGHVDVSWPTAFYDFKQDKADPWVFREFAEAILQGDTVGMATEVFARLHDDENAKLTARTSRTGKLDISDEPAVAQAWIDRNNARGYIVLGDPAVRIDPDKLA
jgi:hypothetical protein